MILKFTQNLKIDNVNNVSVSSEQIVESESEAEEAGESFYKLMTAFMAGYGKANPDAK